MKRPIESEPKLTRYQVSKPHLSTGDPKSNATNMLTSAGVQQQGRARLATQEGKTSTCLIGNCVGFSCERVVVWNDSVLLE